MGDLAQNYVKLNVQKDTIFKNKREAEEAEKRAKELEAYIDKYNQLGEDLKNKEEEVNKITNIERNLKDKLIKLDSETNEIERYTSRLQEY